MKIQMPDIIKAIPKTKERIALARPRTKKPGDNVLMAFGDRVSQIRRARGLSQIEMANEVGLYQADISDFERGAKWPEVTNLIKMAQVLKTSPDELLGMKRLKTNGQIVENRNVFRRIREIAELPKRDRQALLRMIDNTLSVAANGRRVT